VGTAIVRVTLVLPEPAATVDGENVAVAPLGSPVIAKVRFGPVLGGVACSIYVALPPAVTVAVDDPPLGTPIALLFTTCVRAVLVAEANAASPE